MARIWDVAIYTYHIWRKLGKSSHFTSRQVQYEGPNFNQTPLQGRAFTPSGIFAHSPYLESGNVHILLLTERFSYRKIGCVYHFHFPLLEHSECGPNFINRPRVLGYQLGREYSCVIVSVVVLDESLIIMHGF